jgi:hypothetical protein
MEMVNVKAMLGSIPAPNSCSIMEKNKKNIGSQIGQTDKKTFKKLVDKK